MGGTALIAAVKHVCMEGVGEGMCVCVCDCVIAWARKGVCGWDSLD